MLQDSTLTNRNYTKYNNNIRGDINTLRSLTHHKQISVNITKLRILQICARHNDFIQFIDCGSLSTSHDWLKWCDVTVMTTNILSWQHNSHMYTHTNQCYKRTPLNTQKQQVREIKEKENTDYRERYSSGTRTWSTLVADQQQLPYFY